mmetsp:Transcript_1887/g.3299  ORF Transcript_1887/g.3299 Transcript_1887/m.3299 type:complete len:602 (+) Transcript_1887:46-1851(+)
MPAEDVDTSVSRSTKKRRTDTALDVSAFGDGPGSRMDVDEVGTGNNNNATAATSNSNNDGEAKTTKPTGLFHCDFCGIDVTQQIRIKCAICQDFDLCVNCFASGAEKGTHKNNHDYSVMENMHFPLFSPDWGADEELLLLEGIEMYGLGNWNDVAEHVGTKNKYDCEKHYNVTYIDVPSGPLPNLAKVLTKPTDGVQTVAAAGEAVAEGTALKDVDAVPVDGQDEVKGKEDAKRTGRQGTTASAVGPSNRVVSNKAKAQTTSSFSNQESGGWMPKREEFETEWDNDAEVVIADMMFTDEDTEAEKALKLRVLHIYNAKLTERERRRKFIVERGLLDIKKQQALDRKRAKDERDIYQRMRVFARFQTAAEHEALVQGLIEEKRIRNRIEQLKHYREKGIRTLAEAEIYEGEKKKRETQQNLRKARMSASYLYNRQGGSSSSRRGKRDREEPPVPATAPSSSVRPPPSIPTMQDTSRRPLTGKRQAPPLDISHCPKVDLLSAKERELCSYVRVLPDQYLMIKDTLILESMKRGFLKKGTARQIIKIDVNKTSKIFDHLVNAGWIQSGDILPSASPSSAPLPSPPATLPIPLQQPLPAPAPALQ